MTVKDIGISGGGDGALKIAPPLPLPYEQPFPPSATLSSNSQESMVRSSALKIAPPGQISGSVSNSLSLSACPFISLNPFISTIFSPVASSSISNILLLLSASMVNLSAPGPFIVILFVITISPSVRVIVAPFNIKSIVSPSSAAAIASLSLQPPSSTSGGSASQLAALAGPSLSSSTV